MEEAYGRYVLEAYANDGYVEVADAMVRYVVAADVVERYPSRVEIKLDVEM